MTRWLLVAREQHRNCFNVMSEAKKLGPDIFLIFLITEEQNKTCIRGTELRNSHALV